MSPFEFVLLALAVYRGSRLLTLDTLLDGPRMALLVRLPPRSKVAELAECPYCVSVWLAMYAYLAWVGIGWSRPVIAVAALAGAVEVVLNLSVRPD